MSEWVGAEEPQRHDEISIKHLWIQMDGGPRISIELIGEGGEIPSNRGALYRQSQIAFPWINTFELQGEPTISPSLPAWRSRAAAVECSIASPRS